MKRYNYKDNKRAHWMALYEQKLAEARPGMKGKVDWDTAVYLYNKTYLTAEDAAAQYLANHPTEGQ